MLNVVLFEPEIPQNTGNIARTCAATETVLHLVHPLGFSLDEKHVRRAGMDYWKDVKVIEYENIADFMRQHGSDRLHFFTTKSYTPYHRVQYQDGDYLIFGKESAGIPEEILLEHEKQCTRIPMVGETRSLNLSNSVAIAVYEALRQADFESMNTEGHLHRLHWEEHR